MRFIGHLFLLALATGSLLAQSSREAALKNLKFRELGPAIMGGRADDFAVVESNTNIVYGGLASGGLWKTVNGGATWEPVFDNEETSSIGSVAVAQSDPSVVWVGTGEPNNRQSSSWGNGVYRSLDAGKTWQNMGLKDTHHIPRVMIHPQNPSVVYVAAQGHLWGPNRERGVFKTIDGGKTWTPVLFIDENTGVNDLRMDPESPDTLYASAYQRRRTPWGFNGGGPGSAIYKTIDGGATWSKLTKGLPPSGDMGRIALDVYRRNPNMVYALIEHPQGGVFRSEDKGASWIKMGNYNPRPSYFSQIRIDPNNDQRIWVAGVPMGYSEDGGKTFRTNVVRGIHVDFHAFWIDPKDSDHMLAGSDGGFHTSRDRGKSWQYHNVMAIGQYYEVSYDMKRPYNICGGLQDNNSWCGPSATLNARGITNDEWVTVAGGDGFYTQQDPTDPDIVYAESQNGNVLRRDMKTHEARSVRPLEDDEKAPRFRFQWNSPLLISRHDPKTLYYGGNHVFKSTDRGDTWKRLGPDLTTNVDRHKVVIMDRIPDKDMLSRDDGVAEFPTITTISESPLRAGILWAGTDDGNLQVSRDGETWKNVVGNVPGVPKGTYVSRVVASQYAEGTAFAAFDGHRGNDFNPYLFMTTDYGETWADISKGLPRDNGTLHVIREHPHNQNLLFAGTEHGLFISFDRGKTWERLKNNLPTVPVDDIQIHSRDNDLILGTHGRSIWVLDDINALEQMTDQALASELHSFDVRPAISWRVSNTKGNVGQDFFIAPNPPYGAIIDYYLKSKPAQASDLKISILDKDGKQIRELRNPPGEPGVNRAVWDLRYDPFADPPPPREDGEEGPPPPRGPIAEPGEYTVRVSLGSSQMIKKVIVEEDLRVKMPPADRTKRWQAITELYAMAKEAEQNRLRFTSLRDSVTKLKDSWKAAGAPRVADSAQKAVDEFDKKLDGISGRFVLPPEARAEAGAALIYSPPPLAQSANRLLNQIDGYTDTPSPPQLRQIAELRAHLIETSKGLKQIVDEELPRLNKAINDAGVPRITVGGAAPSAP